MNLEGFSYNLQQTELKFGPLESELQPAKFERPHYSEPMTS